MVIIDFDTVLSEAEFCSQFTCTSVCHPSFEVPTVESYVGTTVLLYSFDCF